MLVQLSSSLRRIPKVEGSSHSAFRAPILSNRTVHFISRTAINSRPPMMSSSSAHLFQRGPGNPMAIGTFPSFSTVNFYAGSRLSRLSWLRQSAEFLNDALTSDKTRFVLLNHLNPLVHAGGDKAKGIEEGGLATLSWDAVKETIIAGVRGDNTIDLNNKDGRIRLFGPEAHQLKPENSDDKVTQGMGPPSLALVFLGMDETHLSQASLPGNLVQQGDGQNEQKPENLTEADRQYSPAGVPLFALSLSFRAPGTPEGIETPVEKLARSLTKEGQYEFVDTRALAHAGTWPLHDAAVVAEARSLIDWNERHQYCPACSRRQYSLWAGWKRACASALAHDTFSGSAFVKPFLADGKSFAQDGKGQCPTTQSLSNFCYPRTDPTVIMGIVSPDGEKILLGRQRKWPPGFYSCLAGFLEPGESLEEAVRREIFEESGVEVGRVVYHSSQPWPFPANLMMGAIGQAIDGKDKIRLDLDNELEDARFFTRSEVLDALEPSSRFTFTRQQLAKLDETIDKKALKQQEGQTSRWDQKDGGSVANVTERRSSADPMRPRPSFRIPGKTAIAHVLIAAWARGEAHFTQDNGAARGKM